MEDLFKNMGLGVVFRDFIFGGGWWRAVDKYVQPGKYDEWSSMSPQNKDIYITQALLLSAEATLIGEISNIEYGLKTIIAKVETDESWDEWKNKNPGGVNALNAANKEVNTAKSIISSGNEKGYDAVKGRIKLANFQYVNTSTVELLISGVSDTAIPAVSQPTSAGFSFNSIIELAKQNPIPAIGLLAISVVGIFVLANSGKQKVLIAQQVPKKVDLKGLK